MFLYCNIYYGMITFGSFRILITFYDDCDVIVDLITVDLNLVLSYESSLTSTLYCFFISPVPEVDDLILLLIFSD